MNNFGDLAERFTLHLFGPFKVTSNTGDNVTPRGRKTCGILALLALSPNFERSRKWIQDKLWSDRGEKQGAASLRQCLAELRRLYGSDNNIMVSDRTVIRLQNTQINTQVPKHFENGEGNEPIFLDGLDIVDSEYEEWLREQRLHYKSEISLETSENKVQETKIIAEQIDVFPKFIVAIDNDNGTIDNTIAQSVSGTVGQIVSDMSIAETFSSINDELIGSLSNSLNVQNGIILKSHSANDGGILNIALQEIRSDKVIWSGLVEVEKEKGGELFNSDILRTINFAAYAAVDWLSSHGDEKANAISYYVQGMKLVQKHTQEDYENADECFATAFNLDPKGVFLAWRAYIRSFMIAELIQCDETGICDEANYFLVKAIELAPNNSLVLSMCAHVKSTVFLSFIPAYELARKSVELNPANAFGWASLGIAECHLGRPSAGISHCRKAREITGVSPFKFHIDILSCIVAVMSGHYDEAKHFGVSGHDQAPNLAAPLRFLTALYFYSHEERQAAKIIEKLKILEPSFDLENLKDPYYPSESLRKSKLIDFIPSRQF